MSNEAKSAIEHSALTSSISRRVTVCGDYPGAVPWRVLTIPGETDAELARRLAESVHCDGYTVDGAYYSSRDEAPPRPPSSLHELFAGITGALLAVLIASAIIASLAALVK